MARLLIILWLGAAPLAAQQMKSAQETAFVKALWEEVPACAVAWNLWIKGIGVDSRLFDYQDFKRFKAAKKACEKAFRNLERNGYGNQGGKGNSR